MKRFDWKSMWYVALFSFLMGVFVLRGILWINNQEVKAAKINPKVFEPIQSEPVGEFNGVSHTVSRINIDGVEYLIVEGRGTAIIRHERPGVSNGELP